MRRSLRRRSRAAQALGVTPGQVLANPLPRYDMDFPGCGCSSGVEHDLAKVGVEGSNPFARSSFEKSGKLTKARPPAGFSFCARIADDAAVMPMRIGDVSRAGWDCPSCQSESPRNTSKSGTAKAALMADENEWQAKTS